MRPFVLIGALVLAACGAKTPDTQEHAQSQIASAPRPLSVPWFAYNDLDAEQAAMERDPKSTQAADMMVMRMTLEGGDPGAPLAAGAPGAAIYEWEQAEKFDAFAANAIAQNTLPDGSVDSSGRGAANGMRHIAMTFRRIARVLTAANAVAYAIDREPAAWHLERGRLMSGMTWVAINKGRECLSFGSRGGGENAIKYGLGCKEEADYAREMLWSAYTNWRNAHGSDNSEGVTGGDATPATS
ncbi:MAG TPA: hypothetical protein VF459_09980 [Caulobacteraceae bacterium]